MHASYMRIIDILFATVAWTIFILHNCISELSTVILLLVASESFHHIIRIYSSMSAEEWKYDTRSQDHV